MSETNDTKTVIDTVPSSAIPSDASPGNSDSSTPPKAGGARYEMKKAAKLSLVLAILAAACTLLFFSYDTMETPPFYFDENVTVLPDYIIGGIRDIKSFSYGLQFLLDYSAPILLAVLMGLQGKIRRWLVMVPLAMSAASFLIWLVYASTSSGEFSLELFSSILESGYLNIFICVGAVAVAVPCTLARHPKKIALIGFGAVIALCTVSILFSQSPFGYTDDTGLEKTFYISSYLRYVLMIASVAVFVVASDDHGLTPLLEEQGGGDSRNGAKVAPAAPNPAERLDDFLDASNAASPDSADSDSDGQPSAPDPYDELHKLKSLLDAGAINPEEYETKKKQLLEKIGS